MPTTTAVEVPATRAAALLADATRVTILLALSDGRPRPAGELARRARVTPQTATAHLTKLIDAELLAVERAGRHRYFRLADPARVVPLIEALSVLTPATAPTSAAEQAFATSPLRRARTCYDHLAGVLGVLVADACTERGWLTRDEHHYLLSDEGEAVFATIGVDVAGARLARRAFATACLDWSERRFHLAGALGAALCTRLLEAEWVERSDGRVVRVTPTGRRLLRRHFGVLAV
jgi:DNA-binding transcriptional ArsR family regulator